MTLPSPSSLLSYLITPVLLNSLSSPSAPQLWFRLSSLLSWITGKSSSFFILIHFNSTVKVIFLNRNLMEFLVYILSKVLLQTFWGRFRTQFNLLNMAYKIRPWLSGLISCHFPHFRILCPVPSHTNTTYQRYEIICSILCPLSRCFAFFLDVVPSVCNALLSFLHLAIPYALFLQTIRLVSPACLLSTPTPELAGYPFLDFLNIMCRHLSQNCCPVFACHLSQPVCISLRAESKACFSFLCLVSDTPMLDKCS